MKRNLSNAKCIFAVVILGIVHSVSSQVITHMDGIYGETPFKGLQFTISVDTNVFTDHSTNILHCRIKNGSTNTVIWTRRLAHILIFENTNNGQLYYSPTFEAPDMVQATNQPMLNRSKSLKVGDSYEWIEYFSRDHLYNRTTLIETMKAANQTPGLDYIISNSASFFKQHGNFRMRTSGRLFTPDEEPQLYYWSLKSNSLEIKVAD